MKAFATFIREEPVRAMAILNAIIVVAVAFGAKFTMAQITAIGALAAAIFGVGSQITRSQVQPIAKMEPAQAVQVMEQAKVEDDKPDA